MLLSEGSNEKGLKGAWSLRGWKKLRLWGSLLPFCGKSTRCGFRGTWPHLQNFLLVSDGKIPCPSSHSSSLSLPSPFPPDVILSQWPEPKLPQPPWLLLPQTVTHAIPNQASDFSSRPLLMRSSSLKYSLPDGSSPSYMVSGYLTSRSHTPSLYCTLDKLDTSCSPEVALLSWLLSFAGNVSSQKLSSLPSLTPIHVLAHWKPPHSSWASQTKPFYKLLAPHSTVVWVNLPWSFVQLLSTGVGCWIFVDLNYNSVTSFHLA